MGEDLLRDFVHDEPPPDWEDLKKDLDEDTDIFDIEDEGQGEFEDEYEDGYEDEYEDENEWTDIIDTDKGLDTEPRKIKDDLEEPIWGNGLDDTTWSSDIDDLLWNNTKNDDSNWEEVTEVAITESKDIRPTTAIEGPKSKSTKAIPSASTAAGTSKIYYSKSVPVVTSKPLSIIPSLYVANQEKPKAYTTPTPSSSWSVITKTSSLATMSKSIHISLSFIVESATAEDTISNKVNIRTPIPTSVDKEIAATPSVYSSSPDMPGGYPYEQSHSIGGMGYIGVFSDGGNGIHHSNSLNLLLLIFTLVLLFFHD